jgi:hypothetical protein
VTESVENYRRRAFLEHPDALLDPVKAAMDVGYSESTARTKAFSWRAEHLPALNEKMRTTLMGLGVTADWVKNEVKIIADTTLSDFVEFVEDKEGQQFCALLPTEKIDKAKWRAAIKECEFDTYTDAAGKLRSRVYKLKLYDRQAALVELGNLLGLKNEKLLIANAPVLSQRDEDSDVMAYMTTEELEQIATIQERAAARMRKEAGKRRDAAAIPGETSGGGGHQSSAGLPARRTRSRKTATPPPLRPRERD